MEDALKSSRGRGRKGCISGYTTESQHIPLWLPMFTVKGGFSKSMFSAEYKHGSIRNTFIKFAI
jgi:hypothetical protein